MDSESYQNALGMLYSAVNFNHNDMSDLTVIRTDDIAEWFTHNSTYKFLHRNNQSDLVSTVQQRLNYE